MERPSAQLVYDALARLMQEKKVSFFFCFFLYGLLPLDPINAKRSRRWGKGAGVDGLANCVAHKIIHAALIGVTGTSRPPPCMLEQVHSVVRKLVH